LLIDCYLIIHLLEGLISMDEICRMEKIKKPMGRPCKYPAVKDGGKRYRIISRSVPVGLIPALDKWLEVEKAKLAIRANDDMM
jgi:hypothetical protein